MPATADKPTRAITGRTIRASDRGLEIRFAHDRQLVNVVRKIPRRRFDWQAKVWTAPMSSLPEAIDFLEPLGFDIPQSLYAMLPELLAERERKAAASKQRKAEQAAAAELLDAHPGPIAFVPANDALLTRRIKAAGVYRIVKEETTIGDQHVQQIVGVKVPDDLLVRTLADLGRPTDPASRLMELLRYAFKVQREARRLKPDNACASYRHGKLDSLIIEMCRLAALQDRFAWGWKRNPEAKSDAADWIVYFDRDGQQVRFFHRKREPGPKFAGAWNEQHPAAFPWRADLRDEAD